MTEPKKRAKKQHEPAHITVDATGGEEQFDEARIRDLALKEQKPPKEKRVVLKQGEKPEPKARGRAKAKAKAASIVVIDSEDVDAPTAAAAAPEEAPEPPAPEEAPEPSNMQVDGDESGSGNDEAQAEMVVDTEAAPAAAAPASETKKKKGHRPKKEDKEDLKEKTTCPDCGKTMSLHNLKYLHKSKCKPAQANGEASPTRNIPSSTTVEIPTSSSQQPTYAPINAIATPLQMLTQTQNALEEWRKMRAVHKVEKYRSLTKSFLK